MLSKAASRLAQIWTKQRQQECDRQERQQADKHLKEMEEKPAFKAALAALSEYSEWFRLESGASGEFRIRPAQITGWDRVVKRWAAIAETDPEKAEEQRVEVVKELQDADPDKKFGDPNLFIRLADERYRSVWCQNGTANEEILNRFVKGMKARSDAKRLKVAAYRHPDPYFNPVFCQFGVSRPAVEFRRLKGFTDEPAGKDLRAVGLLLWDGQKADIRVLLGQSKRLDAEIGSACDSAVKGASALPEVSRRGRLGSAAAGLIASAPSKVAGVFEFKAVKRRSAEAEDESGKSKLKAPEWNGTLSADRRDLKRIGELLDRAGKESELARLRGRLRWTLTVSMELEARGPWYDYIRNAADQSPFERTVRKNEDKGRKRPKGTKYLSIDGWPFEEINKPLKDAGASLVVDKKSARGPQASVILSRLPGLRVLSVDLGLRYAAACAVWQAISKDEFDRTGANVSDDGLSATLTAEARESNSATEKARKEGRVKRFVPATIFRRIGPDKLPDGSKHPSPWARLDRQFLIKLQGEEADAREAMNAEIWRVQQFETWAGLAVPLIDRMVRSGWGNEGAQAGRLETLQGQGWKASSESPADGVATQWTRKPPRGVDELMLGAAELAQLALRRHARHAKIAWALDPQTKSVPGMGGKETAFQSGDDRHVNLLLDALVDWHALAIETKWDDATARDLWNAHVASLDGGPKIEPPKPGTSGEAEDRTRQERRKDEEDLRKRLKPITQQLAKANRAAMHQAWRKRWDDDDGAPAKDIQHHVTKDASGWRVSQTMVGSPATGWHAQIRWLTDWIMGWHLDGVTAKRWRQDCGGLSLTRIATMQALYRLHKQFAMRPRPDKPRGAPEKGESNAGIAQSILDALQQLREQRSKQLASRIVEAALGVGSENPEHWEDGTKRPRQFIGDARFAPCHTVVIERLDNYKPDEVRGRRENRQLAAWRKAEFKKRVGEACQLHGLHLREVQAGYTSRQDSRTGAPGVRCQDVPIIEFMSSPFWRKQVARAERKQADGKGDSRERFLVDLNTHWKAKATEWAGAKPVRIPLKGGDLFVSADQSSHASKGLQADLNAGANIGLRAFLDPDWPGRWWYVPCKGGSSQPSADRVKGSKVFDGITDLPTTDGHSSAADAKKSQGEKDRKEIENLWRDPSAEGLSVGTWKGWAEYWNGVQARVIQMLRTRAGLNA